MMIQEHVNAIKNQDIDVVEFVKRFLNQAKIINKDFHFLNAISKDLALEQAKELNKNPKGKLAGLPISVKDSICVKGIESTCGSKILNGYKPVFNATVIERCIKEGAIIIGKTAQDEFGFGTFSTNVGIDKKIPLNPNDKTRSCGGSSGGSAGFTKIMDFAHVSLGESTGGSIAAPASFCGVIGLTPTYGRVSRYGLMDYATSLDKIGPMTKTIRDAALILEVIAGKDKNDSTSSDMPVDNYSEFINKGVKSLKIGIIQETMDNEDDSIDPAILNAVENAANSLKDAGAEVKTVSLPVSAKYGVSAYYIIAMAEASTNLAKYCGMRQGFHTSLADSKSYNEYFTKTRTLGFGEEAKRRIIIGTFTRMAGYREAYYLKAAKVRTKIIEEYQNVFKEFDVLLCPTMPIIAPKFEDIKKLSAMQNYMMDVMTVGPNLAGLPHLSMPCGHDPKTNMPIGMMFVANHFKESLLIQVGGAYERI